MLNNVVTFANNNNNNNTNIIIKTMAQLLDEKTSKWIKGLLNMDDKRKQAIKHNVSISYIDMIINRTRASQLIASDLIKMARKKELKHA